MQGGGNITIRKMGKFEAWKDVNVQLIILFIATFIAFCVYIYTR